MNEVLSVAEVSPPEGLRRGRLAASALLAAIVLFGAALRLSNLDRPDLNADEFGQTLPVAHEMIETGRYVRVWCPEAHELHDKLRPFVPFAAAALSVAALGDTDGSLRLPSALAGTLGVLLMYPLARRLFPIPLALLASFLLAVSPLHILHSREARYYAIGVLASVLVLDGLFAYLERPAGRRGGPLALVALGMLLGATSHHGTVFLNAGVALVLLADRPWTRSGASLGARQRGRSGRWALGLSGALLGTVLLAGRAEAFWDAVVSRFGAGSRGLTLLHSVLQVFPHTGNPSPGVDIWARPFGPLLAAATWLLALVGLVASRRHRKVLALLLAFSLGVPLVAVWVVQPEHFVAPKYVLFSLPVFYLTVLLGIETIARRRSALAYALAVALALATTFVGWPMVAFAREHPGSLVHEASRWIATRFPRSAQVTLVASLPRDASWEEAPYFAGPAAQLVPRYLREEGAGRSSIPVLSSLDEMAHLLRYEGGRPIVVLDALRPFDRVRDRLLMRWLGKNALRGPGAFAASVDPLFLPDPDVSWPAEPVRSLEDSPEGPRRGLRLEGPFESTFEARLSGAHLLLLRAFAERHADAEFVARLDGAVVARSVSRLGPRSVTTAWLSIGVPSPGPHRLTIEVRDLDAPDRRLGTLLDLGLSPARAPRKLPLGAGLEALLVEAGASTPSLETLRVASGPEATAATVALAERIERLSADSTVFLLAKGGVALPDPRARQALKRALARLGGSEGLSDALLAGEQRVLVGVAGAPKGSLAAWSRLSPETGLFFPEGKPVVPTGLPLPFPVGIGGDDRAGLFRTPADVPFHLPRSYQPGSFYLPAAVLDPDPTFAAPSLLERTVAVDAWMRARFLGLPDERGPRVLREVGSRGLGPDEDWQGGTPCRSLGLPSRRCVADGGGWHVLLRRALHAPARDARLRITARVLDPERGAGLQLLLRTAEPDRFLWCTIPVYDAVGFTRPVAAFQHEGGARLEEVLSAELRAETLEGVPVEIEVFALEIGQPAP